MTGPIESATYVGLDWFCLNLFVLALLFVPLELAFARRPDQGVFRRGWLIDLLHLGVSHLAVQLTVLLTLMPAAMFFRWAVHPGFIRRKRVPGLRLLPRDLRPHERVHAPPGHRRALE